MTIVTLVSDCGNAYPGDGARVVHLASITLLTMSLVPLDQASLQAELTKRHW
jgi:hypothetical protein